MDPLYGELYADLYRRHWWWRARERVVLAELTRLLPPGGWRRALDVGCGDGLLFPALRSLVSAVEGVEPDRTLVTSASREDGIIHVRPFDATFTPDTTFDLILFLDVLEHLEDPEGAVDHAAALLDPGGVVLVTVPAFRHLWTSHDDLNHHQTRYTRAEMTKLLSSHLTIVEARYFFRWVHLAKLVQRGVEKIRQPRTALPSLPPPPLNNLLYAASRIDEAALSWLPLPLGSSLLVVARKE
jgi:2-polyprenyl-3-methyl-5-hydroxy-6-metoxy-1,4-benzoquinol methylase